MTPDAPLIDRLARGGLSNPNIERFPGGASNDMIPNLQNPKNPLPYDPMTLIDTPLTEFNKSWNTSNISASAWR